MTESGRKKRPPKELKETNNRVVVFWRKLKKNAFVAFILDIFVIVGSALLLSLIIKTFLIRSFFIPSGSMLETLQIQDRIVVNELVPSLIPVQRGDIVVFKDPGGWLTPVEMTKKTNFWTDTADEVLGVFGITAPDSAQHLIKRVIGLPGDHVSCDGGKLIINGVPITEPYVPKGVPPSTKKFDVTVPAGSYWVMGDNRSDSEDSRYHGDLPSKGFVAQKFIVGQAFVITWPQKHWTWLGNYPDVFKNVPNN
ncbi:MAG: signal peptidase I [Rhodoluna sp.]|nr:signal peptidase I [Rhodoluna sp.]